MHPESPGLLQKVIRERALARRAREAQQRRLWQENDDFHETIRTKLDGLLHTSQFWNYSRCGDDLLERQCRNCGATEFLRFRCNLKWCPRCQWRLTEKRKKVLELWSQRIAQPKHLVLTQKNFPILTRSRIRSHTKALAKMRRTVALSRARGGCVSVEVTNENNGWHLHSHWLLDVRWLDMPSVSKAWGKLVGQEFAIVKVMDCRERSYLQEVTKYVCDGSEMAKWRPEHLLEFVTAIKGRRFFFAFGSLFHSQPEIRRQLLADKRPMEPCECGCDRFTYRDQLACEVAAITAERHPRKSSADGGHGSKPSPGGGSQSTAAQLFPSLQAPGSSGFAALKTSHDERDWLLPRRALRGK